MRARLLCRTGELSGNTYTLAGETVIGSGDGSHVRIESAAVSGRHVRIRPDGEGYVLEDLGSESGTWVDGERVTMPVRLDRLNVISIARAFDLIFHAEAESVPAARVATSTPLVNPPVASAPGPPPPAPKPEPPRVAPKPPEPPQAAPKPPTPVPPPAPAKPATPPASGAGETQLFGDTFGELPPLESAGSTPKRDETIEVGGITRGMLAPSEGGESGGNTMHLEGPFDLPPLEPVVRYSLEISGSGMRTQTVSLTPSKTRYTIGRAMDCDIPLDEEQVSRYHAAVTIGDVVHVEDLGSSNGTHLDGRRLSGPVEIAPGSTFTLGLSISVKLIAR